MIGDISVNQVVVAAIAGGTISEITGGKFANGAITGAYVNMFNQQGGGRPKRDCANRPCIDRNKGGKGWFFQAGIVGSNGTFVSRGGDFGLFVGQDDRGELLVGSYQTATGSVATSAGADIGLLVGFSDSSVTHIEGSTLGVNGGLDTLLVDVMVGTEAFQGTGTGGVFNIQVTLGVEPSVTGGIGGEFTLNETAIQVWFSSDSAVEE